MRKRLNRLLISTAVIVGTVLVGSPAVFADSAYGNNGNGNSNAAAANNTKNDSNNGQLKNYQQASSTSAHPSSASNQSSIPPGNSDHSQGNASTTGAYNQPQPYSKADQNNTGANDTSNTNQYASTRDGSASMNGNGNGQAIGKPCAGCVGKADNKNPKGQYPNGSDHNNGYECDGNHGIGRSNPAHTGCVSTTRCTTNCGPSTHCVTNCSPNPNCLSNCSQTPGCTRVSCVGGRGGGQVLGASTASVAVLGTSTALPNTGAYDTASFWAIMAIISFMAAIIYWRELVMPLLIRR